MTRAQAAEILRSNFAMRPESFRITVATRPGTSHEELSEAISIAIKTLEPTPRKAAKAKPSAQVAAFLKRSCPDGTSLLYGDPAAVRRELWPHLDGQVPAIPEDFPAEALAQFAYRMKYTGPGYGRRDVKPEAVLAAAGYAGAAMEVAA